MEMAEDQDFTFPATTESPPSFFESPPFWPRPTSNEYEDRSFNLCSCQECKANNFNQNSKSYAAAATESPPSFTESPQLWRQPYFPVTLLGNSAGFNLCSCKGCKANNFNQNISSHDAATNESPPLWRQPFSPINQLGNSAGYKNKEYEEKFNLCSCQECKATNFNQINSSSNATTTTTESVRNSGSFRKEEKFNSSSLSPELKASNINISQRKSSSGDYNGQEDKMDILWENLNEEISRTSGKNMSNKEIDNYPSPGRDVQISCVKALKLSKVNRNTLSRKKASVLVFMRVLKRGFAMHRSRRSIKRRTW